jgi:hypothetical protein
MIQDELIDDENNGRETRFVFKPRAVIIWLSVLILGYLFKIMHWPGSSILIICSSAGLSAYCLNALLKLKTPNTLNLILSIGCGIWILILLYGAFFNGGIPYNTKGLWAFATTFAIYFVAYLIILGRSPRKSSNNINRD